MAKKRLSSIERNALKNRIGIARSSQETEKCGVCFYHNQRVCSKHHVITKYDEVCPSFTIPRKAKIYSGGSVSPK